METYLHIQSRPHWLPSWRTVERPARKRTREKEELGFEGRRKQQTERQSDKLRSVVQHLIGVDRDPFSILDISFLKCPQVEGDVKDLYLRKPKELLPAKAYNADLQGPMAGFCELLYRNYAQEVKPQPERNIPWNTFKPSES